jgi:hypothetical protein
MNFNDGVWLTYKDFYDETDRSILIKTTKEMNIANVGDLCFKMEEVLSEQYGCATHVDIAKNKVVLSDKMPIEAAINGSSKTMPLEALARPLEGGFKRDSLVRESTEGLCTELWGLLYSPDYQLNLRISDTLLYYDGRFDCRLYTAESGKGAIRQSLQDLDNSEQTNAVCRGARPNPRGGTMHRALVRYDDEHVQLASESSIPRILRMLNSRNDKMSIVPPQWQCMRSYEHPLNDTVLTCTFSRDPSRRPTEPKHKQRNPSSTNQPPWGSGRKKEAPEKAEEQPHYLNTTAYSFHKRYLDLDLDLDLDLEANDKVGREEDSMYDRPQDVTKRAEPKDMRDIAESLVRETERTLEKVVSFLEKVHELDIREITGDFIQNAEKQLVLVDICDADVRGGAVALGALQRGHDLLPNDVETTSVRFKDRRSNSPKSGRSEVRTFGEWSKSRGGYSRNLNDVDVDHAQHHQRHEKDRSRRGSRSGSRSPSNSQTRGGQGCQSPRWTYDGDGREKLFVGRRSSYQKRDMGLGREEEAENQEQQSSRQMAGGITREGTLRDYKLLCEEQRLEIHRLNKDALVRERKWTEYLESSRKEQGQSYDTNMDRDIPDRQKEERDGPDFDNQDHLHAQIKDLARELDKSRMQDEGDSKRVRTQILNRIEEAEVQLLRVAKLMDLLRDYDPEGVEDMRRLYQEIEGEPAFSAEDEDRRIYEYDYSWYEKKQRMSERVQSLFDEAVGLEQRRKRLRFEKVAMHMWSMHPGTTRKERAIMESLYDLDNERRKPSKDGTAFDAKDRGQAKQHELFARLLESEAGLGLLPSARNEHPFPAGIGSSSFRRKAYDHSLQTRRSGTYSESSTPTSRSRASTRRGSTRKREPARFRDMI